MHPFLMLVLLGFAAAGCAQTIAPPAAASPRLTLDLVAGLGRSGVLDLGNEGVPSLWRSSDRGFAYRAGAGVSYALRDRLSVSGGLRYAVVSLRHSGDFGDLRWGSQFGGDGFDPDLPPGEAFTGRYRFADRYHLIELPLAVRGYLRAGTWRPYVRGGLVPALQLTVVEAYDLGEYGNGAERNPSAPKYEPQLGVAAGLGVERSCGTEWAYFAEPGGQATLLRTSLPSIPRTWDAGAMVGVRRGL